LAVLFCAQTTEGDTNVNNKAHPNNAAAKPLIAEPVTGREKEKPNRNGNILYLSKA
jgi:hypothetical protein